jgi:hypothetical protein
MDRSRPSEWCVKDVVGLRISRFRRSCGVVGPHLPPDLLREGRERQDGAGLVEVGRDLRELLAQAVEDPAELGADRSCAQSPPTGGQRILNSCRRRRPGRKG